MKTFPVRSLLFCFAVVIIGSASISPVGAAYSESERQQIVQFWNEPGRMIRGLPADFATNGLWQVRQTVEGSRWFHAYQRAVGQSQISPGQDAKPEDEAKKVWEDWVVARLAHDEWLARQAARRANSRVLGRIPPVADDPEPPSPGVIPADLLAAVGNPPRFVTAVAPLSTVVTFPEGDSYTYPDHIRLRSRFAYFRSTHGTVFYGTPLRQIDRAELAAVFAESGLSPFEQNVLRAVSLLEGGFEAVNTYDTGYVSVGFIQFITAVDASGSLLQVLGLHKKDFPAEFEADFRSRGIDVGEGRDLFVVDPVTGAELTGEAAVQKIIEDRRLTALFQRAGAKSRKFRIAQIKVAKAHYWPGDDKVEVRVGDDLLTGKVSDIIKSEAGMATLFDRKVNRGSIGAFSKTVEDLMAAKGLKTLQQAALYERDIVAASKYRADFLSDTTLGQPAPPPSN